MLKGIDISYWQDDARLDHAPDFVVCRATVGLSVDSKCDRHYQAAKAAGKLLGVYHYAQPDHGDAVTEADFFVDNVQGYLGEAILVLDYEATDNSLWGAGETVEGSWVRQWVDRVHDRTGVWPVVYIQGSADQRIDDQVFTDCGLWLAQYPGGVDTFDAAIAHGIPAIDSRWAQVTLWQFTSSLDGGSLDGDLFNGDAEAWMAIARGGRDSAPAGDTGGVAPQPDPAPAPTPVPAGSHVIQPGDTLSGIAAAAGIPLGELQGWNPGLFDAAHHGGDLIHVGEIVRLGTGSMPAVTYTVQPGDTLSGIAAQYGTDWPTLASINGIADPDVIHPGQVIRVTVGRL